MRVWFWAVVSTWVALAACQRDGESVRAALAAREAAWNRDLATIKA